MQSVGLFLVLISASGVVGTGVTAGGTYGEGSMEAQMEAEAAARQRLAEYNRLKESNPDLPPLDPLQDPLAFRLANEQSSQSHLQRRVITKDPSTRWPKGIVPYIIQQGNVEAITKAMRMAEYFTCIRFVPWVKNETKTKYGLPNESHLVFVSRNGCWAELGNKNRDSGQGISCCGMGACLHELGHALGFIHEQQNPLHRGWMRVNYQYVSRDAWRWYEDYLPEDVSTNGYDFQSIMHYSSGLFSSGGVTMTFYFPEYNAGSNDQYFFKEMVEAYQCSVLKCPDVTQECHNDGYLTFVDDRKCKCLCPWGLTSSSGCTQAGKEEVPSSWPEGQYGLLTATDQCPSDQFTKKDLTAEYGVQSYSLCEKSSSKGGDYDWPLGNYCILRLNDCPKDFETGSAVVKTTSGANATLEFCCRSDGRPAHFLHLPDSSPFVLFRTGYFEFCFNSWNMNVAAGEMGPLEVVSSQGSLPHSRTAGSKTYFHTCHYAPFNTNCSRYVDLSESNSSVTLTSPGYPNTYSNYECFWFVKAPDNATVVASFEDFQMRDVTLEFLDIWTARMFQFPHHRMKGEKKFSVRSVFNALKLWLRTEVTGSRRGFKVTFKAVLPEKHCYDVSNDEKLYRGDVSMTRGHKSCLPWTDVTHCVHHQFHPRDAGEGLTGNQCRNAGDGMRPWCYFDTKCHRDYCDVCLVEPAFDTRSDCASYRECDSDPEPCAKTCIEKTFAVPPAVTTVTCPAPDTLGGASLETTPSGPFKVGDTVKYKCDTSSDWLVRTCMTNGKWSSGGYVCGGCSDGWARHRKSCYKYFGTHATYTEAEAECAKYGAHVATAKTALEQTFVASMKDRPYNELWLGLKESVKEGFFTWADGKNLSSSDYSGWKAGYPRHNPQENCNVLSGDWTSVHWNDLYCDHPMYKRPFVCKYSVGDRPVIADRREDCGDLKSRVADFCCTQLDYAVENCPKTCGFTK